MNRNTVNKHSGFPILPPIILWYSEFGLLSCCQIGMNYVTRGTPSFLLLFRRSPLFPPFKFQPPLPSHASALFPIRTSTQLWFFFFFFFFSKIFQFPQNPPLQIPHYLILPRKIRFPQILPTQQSNFSIFTPRTSREHPFPISNFDPLGQVLNLYLLSLLNVVDSFDLSDDYLAQLPNDFRLDVINKKSLSSAQEDLCRLMDLVLLREQHARTLLICRGLNVTIDEVCEALLEGVCFTRRSLRILQFLLIAFYPIWKDFKLNRELEYRPFWLYIGSCCGVDTNMPCTYFTI
ncbi:hypothetical protein ACFX15_035084 [Malus domestica]